MLDRPHAGHRGREVALLAIREIFLGNRRFDEMVRQTGRRATPWRPACAP